MSHTTIEFLGRYEVDEQTLLEWMELLSHPSYTDTDLPLTEWLEINNFFYEEDINAITFIKEVSDVLNSARIALEQPKLNNNELVQFILGNSPLLSEIHDEIDGMVSEPEYDGLDSYDVQKMNVESMLMEAFINYENLNNAIQKQLHKQKESTLSFGGS